MDELYRRIEALCEQRGTNVTRMCKAINVPRSCLSDYKAGRVKSLSADKLARIAAYFGISIDSLLGSDHAAAQEDPLEQVSFALFGEHDVLDDELLGELRSYARFKLEERRRKQDGGAQ